MKTIKLFTTIVLLCVFGQAMAQEQLKHEQKMYQNENGRLFINKALPIYLWISTKPDASAAKRLESETCQPYSNPLYLDTEGYNSVHTPSKVDTVTKKPILPLEDIIFEVYADSRPPACKFNIKAPNNYWGNNKAYYGDKASFSIGNRDELSGTEKVYYSLNGAAYKDYSTAVELTNEQEYTVKYYAVDNVGNASAPGEKVFTLDKTPPTAKHEVSGIRYNDIFSQKVTVTLSAEDALSGLKHIKYSIDGGAEKTYNGPVKMWGLKDGDHTITYYAVDHLNNMQSANDNARTVKFYLDITSPDVSDDNTGHFVHGDQYKGKYLFVSERSLAELVASDNKAGIEKILYGIDEPAKTNEYSGKFKFKPEKGLQKVNYFAIDRVQNQTPLKSFTVYMDNVLPNSSITYGAPQFFTRDTLFINKNTKIKVNSWDNESGLQKKEYLVDGASYGEYTEQFTIESQGYHKIKFRATDRVNNVEQEKESEIVVDNDGPEIYVNFSIKSIGKKKDESGTMLDVYPTYTRVYIGATDIKCGAESIFYSINDGPMKNYVASTNNISKDNLLNKKQKYSIKVNAKDKLGNENEKIVDFFVGDGSDEVHAASE